MICSPATAARGEDYKPVMPAAAETYSLGAPVEIGRIEQELKKLWQDGEGAMTRASLMNLAVYSEKPGSLQQQHAIDGEESPRTTPVARLSSKLIASATTIA